MILVDAIDTPTILFAQTLVCIEQLVLNAICPKQSMHVLDKMEKKTTTIDRNMIASGKSNLGTQ